MLKAPLVEKLESFKSVFKSPLSTYYRQSDGKTKKDDARLKKNENELIKKISEYLVDYIFWMINFI